MSLANSVRKDILKRRRSLMTHSVNGFHPEHYMHRDE